MNLLLDTHIWLWSLLDPARLGSRVREALEAHEHELWLAERGRLALAPEPETWVRTSLARSPVIEAPLTIEVAIESRRVNLSHEDPADRFLAATARVYDLTLVTADARLLAVPDLALLANE